MEKITQSKEQIDRIEFHKALCDGLHRLYLDKNSDYGDSFRKVREELPWAILVRLSDKLNRLKSLIPKDSEPRVNESIDDTLMDIANYALLELVERGVGKTALYLFLTRRTECPEHFSRSPTHLLVDVKMSAHARLSEATEDDQYEPFCPD